MLNLHMHNEKCISEVAKLALLSVLFFGSICFQLKTNTGIYYGFFLITDLSLSEYTVIRTCVGVVAKGFSEAAFTTAFLYTAELYPTVLR